MSTSSPDEMRLVDGRYVVAGPHDGDAAGYYDTATTHEDAFLREAQVAALMGDRPRGTWPAPIDGTRPPLWERFDRWDVVTYAWNDTTNAWEAIERERAARVGTDLDNVELSAHDLGCAIGARHKVALVDYQDDQEIRAVEATAR